MRKLLAVLIIAVLLFITGCTTDYDRSDIQDYIKDNLGISEYTLSKTYREVEGEDGYTDRIWDVKLNDGSGVRFKVIDDYYYGMEAVTNVLYSDYEDNMLIYYTSKYDGFDKIQVLKEREEEKLDASLYGMYDNRSELNELFEEVFAFKEYVTEQGYTLDNSFFVYFAMNSPIRTVTEIENGEKSYTVTDGDYSTNVTSINEEDIAEATEEFIKACADYRFNDKLADFTEEEINMAVRGDRYEIWVREPHMEQGMYRLLDGLSASNYSYGISFGCLYEILREVGIEAEGDVWHYSFTAADGSVYEISYDFCEYQTAAGVKGNHYYYIKDNETVFMEYYFYNHFSEIFTEQLIGMDIIIGNPADK